MLCVSHAETDFELEMKKLFKEVVNDKDIRAIPDLKKCMIHWGHVMYSDVYAIRFDAEGYPDKLHKTPTITPEEFEEQFLKLKPTEVQVQEFNRIIQKYKDYPYQYVYANDDEFVKHHGGPDRKLEEPLVLQENGYFRKGKMRPVMVRWYTGWPIAHIEDPSMIRVFVKPSMDASAKIVTIFIPQDILYLCMMKRMTVDDDYLRPHPDGFRDELEDTHIRVNKSLFDAQMNQTLFINDDDRIYTHRIEGEVDRDEINRLIAWSLYFEYDTQVSESEPEPEQASS